VAFHEFKHRGKVLQFSDSDVLMALDDRSRITHGSFMEASRRIVLGHPSSKVFDDAEFEEIASMPLGELDKGFQFSMTSLLKSVYAL